MNEFVSRLFDETIDTSWSKEADRKVNEEDIVLETPRINHRQRHTVSERRKTKAKAKAYAMPKCGIRPTVIREMVEKKMPGASDLATWSEKAVNQNRHMEHSNGHCSREKAKRGRYPHAVIDQALEENQVAVEEELVDEDFGSVEPLSTLESLNIFEEMELTSIDYDEWRLIDEMIDNGEMYLTPQGGVFLASSQAFKFACEHEDAVLALIMK